MQRCERASELAASRAMQTVHVASARLTQNTAFKLSPGRTAEGQAHAFAQRRQGSDMSKCTTSLAVEDAATEPAQMGH
jgi:hypothetical protein